MKKTSMTRFIVREFRQYGEAKLKKPKELRGINQSLSVPYNPNCRCGVFLMGTDVWVKHRDYFSGSLGQPQDYGLPLNNLLDKHLGKERAKKFVYEDAWGDLLGRNEAWIKLESLLEDINSGVFPPVIVSTILRQQEQVHHMQPYDLECTYAGNYMVRFWSKLVMELQSEMINL